MQKKTKRLLAALGLTFLALALAWTVYGLTTLIIVGETLDAIIGGLLYVAAIVCLSLLLPKKLRLIIRVFGFTGAALLLIAGICMLLGLRTVFPGLELSVLIAMPPLLALLPLSFVRFKKEDSRRNILSAALVIAGAALLALYPFYLFLATITYRTPDGMYESPDGKNKIMVFYPSMAWIDPYSSVYAVRFGVFTVEEDSVFAEEDYRSLQFGEAKRIEKDDIHWESNDSVTVSGDTGEFGICTYRIRFDAGFREKQHEYVPKDEIQP